MNRVTFPLKPPMKGPEAIGLVSCHHLPSAHFVSVFSFALACSVAGVAFGGLTT